MIQLTQHEPLASHPDLYILSPSGEYNETDLIECYSPNKPNVPLCAYQAQYVRFGEGVYHQAEALTESQVEALEVNVPMESVINNEELMNGRIDPLTLSENGRSHTPQEKQKLITPKEDNAIRYEPVTNDSGPDSPNNPAEVPVIQYPEETKTPHDTYPQSVTQEEI